MTYEYIPQGVCSKRIKIEIEGGKLVSAEFEGGCHGNLQGICSLVRGMDCDEVLRRLEGINCRGKGTSCPDQLSRAIREAQRQA
ncbi:MAG: TIGR03905 family TSCPD domain-containing protein [Alloprevotella sp.]|nr:TIGR03905 family TSCPD domain-containing protein [Alloprevotella sp.]